MARDRRGAWTLRRPRTVSGLTLLALLAAALSGSGTAAAVIWRVQPSPAVDGALNGVSCRSASWCVAVGENYPFARPLIELWNGRRWSIQVAAKAGRFGSELDGVSCTSRTACTAVGNFSGSSGSAPLAERWNGRRWAVQKMSMNGVDAPQSVSCTSARTCTAIGFSTAWQWNGTHWTRQILTGGEFKALSCTSRTFCIGVGSGVLSPNSSRSRTAVQRWNGISWRIHGTPFGGDANAVSCTSLTACTAVGSFVHLGTRGAPGFALRWNGGQWSIQPSPTPGGYSLNAVSCTSRRSCTAVGEGYSGVYRHVVGERWNGRRWLGQAIRNPAQSDNDLFGVSCASETSCTAVGASENGNQPLIEQSAELPRRGSPTVTG